VDYKKRRVLLVLSWYDHRLQRGIEKYAQEHGWHLSPEVTRERTIPWGWNGDGILAWLAEGDDLAEFVARAKKPTVDFSFRRPQLKFARVLFDHEHGARLVADHFLTRGFEHFLYYHDFENWSFKERGRAFTAEVTAAGKTCRWIRWQEATASSPTARHQDWKRKRAWLASELRQAPKPLAVFAPSDWMAVDIVETCESIGLSVPEEVAVVGADNLILAADTMPMPISTVDPNLEYIGHVGAALLDDLMDGKPPPEKPIRVPSGRLILRKSSDLVAVNHDGVAKSLRFIWRHFHEPIGVADVARSAGMCTRGLQKAFVEHIRRSPGQELHRVRIDHAKQVLASCSEKTESVAAMCGYANLNSFWVAFRRATGMSPAQYRKRFGSLP